MTQLNSTIKFWAYINDAWVDYTEGMISCNVVRGIQNYEGPWTQPDVGQLNIVTRNINLDPYENDDIKYNVKVKLTANDVPIFTGKIDGIDVQYQPKGKPPRITLTVIDYLGSMQRHTLSNTFVKRRLQIWTPSSFIQDMQAYSTSEMPDFVLGENYYGTDTDCTGSIDSNTPAWEAFALMASTDLGNSYVNVDNEFCYYHTTIDNENHPNNARPIKATFASDGSELSYIGITLNDGLDQLCNEFSITKSSGIWSLDGTTFSTTSSNSTHSSTYSKNIWGKIAKTLLLKTNNSIPIADQILAETSKPRREVVEITVDSAKNANTIKDIELLDNIYISHEVNETTSIERKYGIIGIRHNISLDTWETTYILRNWNYVDTELPKPTFTVTPTSGNTNTQFVYELTNYDVNDGYEVTWYLGAGFYVYNQNTVTQQYSSGGTLQTWVEVTNQYGWKRKSDIQTITVTTAPPYVDFSYIFDAYLAGKVYFTSETSGATSVLWTFGDGTTSTQENPEKIYSAAGGTYNVTLQATNQFGTSTITKQVVIPAGTPLTIRYLAFGCQLEPNPEEYTTIPNIWYRVHAYNGSGVDYLADKDCIEINNGNMFINNQDLPQKPWLIEPELDTNFTTYTEPKLLTYPPDPASPPPGYIIRKSEYGRLYQGSTAGYTFAFKYDLGANYTDITQIQAHIGMTTVGQGNFYPMRVYGSPDNITWYKIGQFNFEERTDYSNYINGPGVNNDFYGWTVTMTGDFGMPPQAPGLQVQYFDTSNRPMRYVRGTITDATFKLFGSSGFAGVNQSNAIIVNPTTFTGSPSQYLGGTRVSLAKTSGTVTNNATGGNVPDGYVEAIPGLVFTNFSGTITVDFLKSFNNIWGMRINTDLGGQTNDKIVWEHSTDAITWEPFGTQNTVTSSGTTVNSYLRNNLRAPIIYGSSVVSSANIIP